MSGRPILNEVRDQANKVERNDAEPLSEQWSAERPDGAKGKGARRHRRQFPDGPVRVHWILSAVLPGAYQCPLSDQLPDQAHPFLLNPCLFLFPSFSSFCLTLLLVVGTGALRVSLLPVPLLRYHCSQNQQPSSSAPQDQRAPKQLREAWQQ